MSLLSPDVVNENTFEHEVWSFGGLQSRGSAMAKKQFGTTTFSGSYGCEPQGSTTGVVSSYLNLGQETTTVYSSEYSLIPVIHPAVRRWISVNVHEIFSAAMQVQSLPLTEEELSDIHIGLEEIRTGKAKSFSNVRETIEWLHRRRA